MSLRIVYQKEQSKVFYGETPFIFVPYSRLNQLVLKAEDEYKQDIFSFAYIDEQNKRFIWRMFLNIIFVQKELQQEFYDKDFLRKKFFEIKTTWLASNHFLGSEEIKTNFQTFWKILLKKQKISFFDFLIDHKDNKVVRTIIIPCEIKERENVESRKR